MLLPDKYVPLDQSIIGQVRHIIDARRKNQTVNDLWNRTLSSEPDLTFDRFSLILTFLYSLGVLQFDGVELKWRRS
jgi:hypothetical protein